MTIAHWMNLIADPSFVDTNMSRVGLVKRMGAAMRTGVREMR